MVNDNQITVLITTYTRQDALNECLQSIQENEPFCKVIVIVDNDDLITYCGLQKQEINAVLVNWKRECIAQTNLGVSLCETPYFVYLNDDMVLTQKNCFQDALKIFMEKFPDDYGFITFDDGIQMGRIATQGLTSKKFVKDKLEHGLLCNPAYKHFCWDAEQAIRMKKMGSYLYLPEIKVTHKHRSVTGRTDKVYRESITECLKVDHETFKRRNPDEV